MVTRRLTIPHSKPTLGEREARVVAQVVRSGYVAEGSKCLELEQALAACIGVKHAAAVNTGSSALHLALLALEVGQGDHVLTPTYVCTALLNAIHYVGAEPVLVDADDSLNMCPTDCRQKLTPRTKAIIVPHMFGTPAAVDDMAKLGPPIIEDCAQAIGATLPDGRAAGARGAISIFSFYATKMLAAGECGMVAANSSRLVDRVRDLKDYDERRTYKVRYNYKCNDVAAALALCQLEQLPKFLERRRALAKRYASALKSVRPCADNIDDSTCFRVVAQAPGRAQKVIDELQGRGIGARKPIFKPLHRYLGQSGFPKADWASRSAVSLPVYPSLSAADCRRVVDAAVAAGC